MSEQTVEAVNWHLPTMLRWIDENRTAKTMPSGELVGAVLRIAAERIERFDEREAQARIEGVRAGIEASAGALINCDPPGDVWPEMEEALHALNPAAIVEALARSAALSDLIAGDADMIDGGDDGKQ